MPGTPLRWGFQKPITPDSGDFKITRSTDHQITRFLGVPDPLPPTKGE